MNSAFASRPRQRTHGAVIARRSSDGFRRSNLSIVSTCAEGAGRSGRDQARHYAIARGSAFECLAVLDLLDLETAPPSSREARIILIRLTAVLTALIRR